MLIVIDLAIVIVNYNVCELLRRCLRSIYARQGEFNLMRDALEKTTQDRTATVARAAAQALKQLDKANQ